MINSASFLCTGGGAPKQLCGSVLVFIQVGSYLGVAEDRTEGSSQMCPQGKSVHKEVLLSGGQLQKASEALEASVVMML